MVVMQVQEASAWPGEEALPQDVSQCKLGLCCHSKKWVPVV